MFENETKGWHGSYSTAGRNSAEKYHIIIHKDEILSNEPKRIHIKDIFTPDEPQPVESLEDNIDIFKVYSNDQKNKMNFVPKSQGVVKKVPQKIDRLKYHNKHMQEGDKRKKIAEPPCTRYNPKHTFVWPRTITGPKWKILRGRDRKPLPIDTKDFYIHNEPMELKSKCFVNMRKQTQRGDFTELVDLRIRTDKPYSPQSTSSNKISYDTTKSTTIQNFKKSLSSSYTNLSTNTLSSPHISGPDFRTTISREQVERIKGVKGFPMAFIQPNFAIRWERPKTMAVYDKPKKNKPRNKTMIGIDPSINFDPNKVIDKVNNHRAPTAPNFDMMTSRPNKAGPLPSFMQKMYTRESAYCMTEKSLKENNFSNAKFMSATTSFFPKRSYNKIINLNLLNGEVFKDKVDETVEKEKNKLISSMKFYHKNFDDLIKEGYLNKFDNVTYKTIKHEHKIDPGDMEKFLLNFDNVDA